MRLPEDEFVDSRLYLKELQKGLMKIINPVWETVRLLFDERRTSDTYLKLYRLQNDATGKLQPVPLK